MKHLTLTDLGWSDHFARQIMPGHAGEPARISDIHRDRVVAYSPNGQKVLLPDRPVSQISVGDWVMHDGHRVIRRLTPKSEIRRKAAGDGSAQQLVAANVDTFGIVTSCNADFNIARIERYLALALASDTLPLVILTKADQVQNPADFVLQSEKLSPLLTAIAIDARNPEDVARIFPWCKEGQTLALAGSSGVGKTTLRNGLTGEDQATAGIREDDGKGRHTTTARAMRPSISGGWIIDTPGMRELGLSEVAHGIDQVFSELTDLAAQCRFSDCSHETEPGCAVKAAIEAGQIDTERVRRWKRLQREDMINSETVAQTRARHKSQQKTYNEGKRRGKSKRNFDD